MPPQHVQCGLPRSAGTAGAGKSSESGACAGADAQSESGARARVLLPRAADPERGGRFMMVLRSRKNASPANGLVKKSAMLAVVETNGTTSSSFSTSSLT